jgi:hypothetical protein
MEHALDVMMFCAGSAEALQSARGMIAVGRKVVSGAAGCEGNNAAVQQFGDLHKNVRQFCSTTAVSSVRGKVLCG